MRTTTELERRKASMLKAYRAAIRLKYSLLADEEIGRELPRLEKEIDRALQNGEPLVLNPGSVFYEDEVQ